MRGSARVSSSRFLQSAPKAVNRWCSGTKRPFCTLPTNTPARSTWSVRLGERHRQQHTAAMHHRRALGQRREVPGRKLLPGCQTLGRGGFPCPGVPSAGIPALHGLVAAAGSFPPGTAGIGLVKALCGLSLAFAGLFARLGGRLQPELLFGAVLAGSRQGAGP